MKDIASTNEANRLAINVNKYHSRHVLVMKAYGY